MTRTRVLGVVAVAGLVGVAAWWVYAGLQVGRVELTTDGPPLIVQLLAETGGRPLGAPFDLVTRSVLALPAGEYQLRVHGSGRLGRTYRLGVNPGETRTYPLTLDEGRLLGREPVPVNGNQPKPREEPIPFRAVTAAATLTPGRADLIEISLQSLLRRDAITGKAIWEVAAPAPGPDPQRLPATWFGLLLSSANNPGGCPLVEPAADLDGDGIADLIWAFQHQAAFLAVSGKDGAILWDFFAALDGPGGPRPTGPDWRSGPNGNRIQFDNELEELGGRWRQVIGTPAAADLDGDGAPDLIATVVFSETKEELDQRTGPTNGPTQAFYRRFVVAVSGRSGREIWNYPMDAAFAMPSQLAWQRSVMVVRGGGSVLPVFVDGTRWVGLDAATGRPRLGPIDLGFEPVRPVQHADLDGDGRPEILALGPGRAGSDQTLVAVAAASGQTLWTEPIHARYAQLFDMQRPPDWPLVADLDGDGRPEIAVADAGALPPGPGYRGLRLLDGTSGRSRWTRSMRPETAGGDGLLEVAAAPDLDGDGVRDLIATSYFLGRNPSSAYAGTPPVPERVYVDALSGRDGHPLWYWHRDQPTDRSARLQSLQWWGRGPDGWPLLAVGLGDASPGGGFHPVGTAPAIVHNLEASTGRDVATAVDLEPQPVADLDGDGLLDLWGAANGLLEVFRGEAPAAWSVLGQFVPAADPDPSGRATLAAAADLDGDGIADVLSADLVVMARLPTDPIASQALEPALAQGFPTAGPVDADPPGSATAVARSGRDGHVLWRARLDDSWPGLTDNGGKSYQLAVPSLPAGDLDGDGTADVLVQTQPYGISPTGLALNHPATVPIQVRSGRTGRRLWAAGPLPLGYRAFGDASVYFARALVVEPAATPDLIVAHFSPFTPTTPAPGSNAPGTLHLARLAGRTGQFRWDLALMKDPGVQVNLNVSDRNFGDLDGDGALDVALVIPTPGGPQGVGYEVQARALHDGRLLWTHRLEFGLRNVRSELIVADLDGDGRAEVIVNDRSGPEDERLDYTLQALDGRDGQPRWRYRANSDGQPEVNWTFLVADLDGPARRSVCLFATNQAADAQGVRRLVVLNSQGQVHAERDLVDPAATAMRGSAWTFMQAVDLAGDRRDELLFFSRHRLHVWGPDLQEIWSRPEGDGQAARVIPRPAGQTATLLLDHPVVALDAGDGHPRWAGHALHSWWTQFYPQLLDPGTPDRPPLLIAFDRTATTCRQAIPPTADGASVPARGTPVPPGLTRLDPRWTRPLPWAELAERTDLRSAALVAVGLAVLNVGLPLVLLRLVAGRRRSLRVVLALPVAAAFPLLAFATLEPRIPPLPAPWPASVGLLAVAGSLAGVPLLIYPALVAWAVLRRRWRSLLWLGGAAVAASLAVGAVWLLRDRETMPAIEHYTWAGWAWVLVPGTCVAGALILLGWAARAALRLVARFPAGRSVLPGNILDTAVSRCGDLSLK